MSPHRERTPDWLLERIALGELPPDALARAKARLLAEPDGPARLAALEQDSRDTLAALPPAAVAAEVQRRAHLGRTRRAHAAAPRRTPSLLLALPVAAGVAALVVWAGRSAPAPEPGVPPQVAVLEQTGAERIKGEARLVLHRQTGGAPERLRDGASARAGDVLQLGYVAAGAQFGVVVSVDGRGAVTLHLPERGGRAAALAQGREGAAVALPSAYELDDAPAFERFFLVTSAHPFDVAPVQQAAEQLARSGQARTAPLPLPSGLEQTAFLLQKAQP